MKIWVEYEGGKNAKKKGNYQRKTLDRNGN
jgi:hypothetical protein